METLKNGMIFVMFVVVILNLSLSVYTLNVVRNASTQLSTGSQGLSDVTTQLNTLSTLASNLMTAIGPATRLDFNIFPINVPDVLNEFLRVPFRQASGNITRLALAVESAMRRNTEPGMLQTARYASLVASITGKVGQLKKVVGAGVPVSDPANNDLLHLLTSALLNVVDFQFDSPVPWNRLAQTCVSFIDNFLAVNWSGTYRDEWGQIRTWNINNAIVGPFQSVYDYCEALSNLTEAGGSVLDMFDGDSDEFKKD